MSNWHRGRMACFDIESTGVDPHRDRIVTAATVDVGGGQETRITDWLLNPGIEIPQGAIDVHGVTNEQAATGADPENSVAEIAERLLTLAGAGVPIVGHNVVYDLTLLWAELTRHGHHAHAEQVASVTPVIDTMVIEKSLDPYRPASPETAKGRRPDWAIGSHKLIDCCRLWGVPLSEEDAHGAAADALAAGRLAWRLATEPKRFVQFDGPRGHDRINPPDYPLDVLHKWQASRYAAEATRFQSYMRGEQRRKPEDVDPTFVASTSWPVSPPPADWSPEQLPAVREQEVA